MAKKPVHIGNRDTDFIITRSNRTYVLDGDDVIHNADIKTDPGRDIDNIVLKVKGTIWDDAQLAIGSAGSVGNRIEFGKDALLNVFGAGILAIGDKTKISNFGTFIASDNTLSYGIVNTGDDGRIVNDGFLQAALCILVNGDGNRILNSGLIAGYPGTLGIQIGGEAGDVNRFENTGTLSASLAVWGGDGRDIVINKGDYSGATRLGRGDDLVVTWRGMRGDVELQEGDDKLVVKGKGDFTSLSGGQGNDTFDLRAGKGISEFATISGGMDDDMYLISRDDLVLLESPGEGTDTVKSSVIFTLGAEFENLVLIGKKPIDGTGNDLANVITGNAARNRISGQGGADIIDARGGNDVMSGGMDAYTDTFIIRNGSGKDVITDFGFGSDLIDLSAYKGIRSFADLEDRIRSDGDGGTYIDLLKGDRLQLRDFDPGNLLAIDFTF